MQYKGFSTKPMIEASLLTAIFVIAMLIEVYIPFVNIIVIFIISLPITLIYVKNGLRYAIASLVVASAIGILLIDPIVVLPLIVNASLVGLALGFCVTHNIKPSKTYIYTTVAFLLSLVITIAMISLLTDVKGMTGIVDTIVTQYNLSIDKAKQFYLSAGISKQQVEKVFSQTAAINREAILTMFPGAMIILSLLSAYLNYKFTSGVFRRLKIKINELRSFEFIYIPNMLAAVMIILICLGLILQTKKIGLGGYIFNSTSTLFCIALLIEGMATTLYFLKSRLRASKIAVVIIIFSALLLRDIILLIGIVELIFDFRKLDPRRVKNTR